MSLRLDWCSHTAAKYAVEHWHYSQVLPTPPYVRVGVWEFGKFIGVVLFSHGAASRGPDQFGLTHTEFCELTRIALNNHIAPVSRIVSIALRLLKSQCPGLRLVVSYADPNHGHAGGIYQAGGWLYVGQANGTTEYIAPDGKQWHSRMISSSGATKVYGKYRAVWRPEQCQKVNLQGKHKYLMPLDQTMRKQIVPMIKPFPKHASEVPENGTPVSSGRGRCDATRTLQSFRDTRC